MPSAFSQNKNIEEPAAGSYNDVWAPVVNANWALIDTALAGNTTIDVTGVAAGVYVLTLAQYQPPNIIFSGPLSGNLTYTLPTGVGWWGTIFNNTSGAFTLTFAASGGGSMVLPQGERTLLVSDGTNVTVAQSAASGAAPTAQVGLTPVNGSSSAFMRADGAPALNQGIIPTWTGIHTFAAAVIFQNFVDLNRTLTLVSPSGSINGASGASVTVPTVNSSDNSSNAASTAFVYDVLAASPALGGAPTAATAASGTSTRQIATTAFAVGTGNLAANGYWNLPSGLQVRWGSGTGGSDPVSVSYASPFANATFVVMSTTRNSSGGNTATVNTSPAPTASGFQVFTGGANFFYLAFGF